MQYSYRTVISALLLSTLVACSGSSNEDKDADGQANENPNENLDPNQNLDPDGSTDPISIGVLLGFTGPVANLAVDMAAGAELAINEVSNSGKFLSGKAVEAIRGDSTCTDADKAVEAFDQLILDNVAGVVGAVCSGVTTAAVNKSVDSAGMVIISPSATSPALSTISDDGLFFRTAPSDSRTGSILSQLMLDRNIQSAAVTYTNNDYGKGFADAFKAAYEDNGGAVTLLHAHEDGMADYSTDLAALSNAGGDALVVLGYLDQGGADIIQASVNANAFTQYALGDGMVGQELIDNVEGLSNAFGIKPGLEENSLAVTKFAQIAENFDSSSPYSAESYDAAALILLAMQAAESIDPSAYKSQVTTVANAPGEKIYAGELGKALDLLAAGTAIDYVGASNVELIGPGESAGSYVELELQNGAFVQVRVVSGQL